MPKQVGVIAAGFSMQVNRALDPCFAKISGWPLGTQVSIDGLYGLHYRTVRFIIDVNC